MTLFNFSFDLFVDFVQFLHPLLERFSLVLCSRLDEMVVVKTIRYSQSFLIGAFLDFQSGSRRFVFAVISCAVLHLHTSFSDFALS